MVEMNNPNNPATKSSRNSSRRAMVFFFILAIYLGQGFLTGNWTNGMSEQRREMLYISLAALAAYYIWVGICYLIRSRASKSDRDANPIA
jgi:hypothetical protein